MTDLRTIAIDDPAWTAVVRHFPQHSIYHTQDYQRLSTRPGDVTLLLSYESDALSVAFPITLRRAPVRLEARYGGARDATSLYGYPGILHLAAPGIPASEYQVFTRTLMSSLRDLGVVALFVRTDPLHDNSWLAKCVPDLVTVPAGSTFAIDTESEDTVLAHSAPVHRRELRKLTTAGVTVGPVASASVLEWFAHQYLETMQRLGAAERYKVGLKELLAMFEGLEPNCELWLAQLNGQSLAAAILFRYGTSWQYHLGATISNNLKAAVPRLILHQAAQEAHSDGAKRLHLGGGVGGSNDGVLQFKRSVSSLSFPFYTVRAAPFPHLTELHSTLSGAVFPPYVADAYGPRIYSVLDPRSFAGPFTD